MDDGKKEAENPHRKGLCAPAATSSDSCGSEGTRGGAACLSGISANTRFSGQVVGAQLGG